MRGIFVFSENEIRYWKMCLLYPPEPESEMVLPVKKDWLGQLESLD